MTPSMTPSMKAAMNRGARLAACAGLLAACSLPAAPAAAQQVAASQSGWPRFLGPHGDGVASTASLPAELTADSRRWSVDLPGRGLSGVLVAAGRLVVTCSSGPEQSRLHVVCLDPADGRTLWHRQFRATGRTMCHAKTSVAAATPCTDAGRIYAAFSSNDVVCLDFDGNLLWLRGITSDYANVSNSLGMASSPVATEGTLVLQVENDSESYALGLDGATGANRWKLDRPKAANWTSPAVLRPDLVALQSKTGIDAVRVADGSVAWSYGDGASTIPSSCLHAGVLCVPSHGITALAVEAVAAGAQPKQLWRSNRLSPGTASPIAVGDTVLAISKGDVLTAGSLATGERLWQLRVEGPFTATPVSDGRLVACVSEKGLVQLVDITGAEPKLVSSLDLGDEILASPALADGGLYLRSNTKLYKLGR
jgi:outer membrane protein assembly factor BamB